ncbi:cryptochrome/photolyase family protein [Exiguobacterium undae]
MATRWIFGNQLNHTLPLLQEADLKHDVILMVEATSRSTWKTYHKQKLVLIFSAMRHFADELRDKGFTVDYREADSFDDAWKEHQQQYKPTHLLYTAITDHPMRRVMERFQNNLPKTITVDVRSDVPLFLLTQDEAVALLGDKPWKMDRFYRQLRKDRRLLMSGNKPLGGKWSFDADNRKPAKHGVDFKAPIRFRPDQITRDVIHKVETTFADHPGQLDAFHWPVTRAEAQRALARFIEERLETFGTYQDAMLTGEDTLSHSLLSSSINIGLLSPDEVIKAAAAALEEQEAPLNAVEGFIRQILGWREYMRAVYLSEMPGYEQVNVLKHDRDLPDFFWDGQTTMTCVAESLRPVIETAHNHHIQRLMVLGNFANLFEISPQQTADWFNEMYIDAYDWVVLPNVLGMALHADGGLLSTKPYIASANYIHKMSDYCGNCLFNQKDALGDNACPFNALYWDFIARHEERFSGNQRMSMMYRQWAKRDQADQQAIRKKATALKKQLADGQFHR